MEPEWEPGPIDECDCTEQMREEGEYCTFCKGEKARFENPEAFRDYDYGDDRDMIDTDVAYDQDYWDWEVD